MIVPGSCMLVALVLAQGAAAKVDPLDAIVAEAERDAREGRYDKARAAYAALARKHPGTPQGLLGEKRSRPSAYLGWAPI
jgi:outer membrane protein assembly factor BamD (BamD/ComL family)